MLLYPLNREIEGPSYRPRQATNTPLRPVDKTSRVEQTTASSSDTSSAWPEAFLADFESRIWMTYRSHFAPIPRNNSPEATSSMTLGVRLRSQLMDSQGFTSDTGWGCMIRSGQSLLANALCIQEFGRGEELAQTTDATRKADIL